MVKYFSVDWLAQSHQSSAPSGRATPVSRPHVPCMVQPRPPAYGSSHLQLKPKASRPVQEPNPGSPAVGPAGCVSPGKSPNSETEATDPSISVTLNRLFLHSFRDEWVFLRVRERGGFLRVSLCGGGREGASAAPSAHQVHHGADRQAGEDLQQAQISGRWGEDEDGAETRPH